MVHPKGGLFLSGLNFTAECQRSLHSSLVCFQFCTCTFCRVNCLLSVRTLQWILLLAGFFPSLGGFVWIGGSHEKVADFTLGIEQEVRSNFAAIWMPIGGASWMHTHMKSVMHKLQYLDMYMVHSDHHQAACLRLHSSAFRRSAKSQWPSVRHVFSAIIINHDQLSNKFSIVIEIQDLANVDLFSGEASVATGFRSILSQLWAVELDLVLVNRCCISSSYFWGAQDQKARPACTLYCCKLIALSRS